MNPHMLLLFKYTTVLDAHNLHTVDVVCQVLTLAPHKCHYVKSYAHTLKCEVKDIEGIGMGHLVGYIHSGTLRLLGFCLCGFVLYVYQLQIFPTHNSFFEKPNCSY